MVYESADRYEDKEQGSGCMEKGVFNDETIAGIVKIVLEKSFLKSYN